MPGQLDYARGSGASQSSPGPILGYGKLKGIDARNGLMTEKMRACMWARSPYKLAAPLTSKQHVATQAHHTRHPVRVPSKKHELMTDKLWDLGRLW